MLEFPLRLKSELAEFSVGDKITVREMNDEMKRQYLGIWNCRYDEEGRLSGCTGRGLHGAGTDILNMVEFQSSNYLVIVSNFDEAVDFNFALKLVGLSCSSLYQGFIDGRTNVGEGRYYINPPNYFGTTALPVSQSDVERLSRLLVQVKAGKEDRRLKILSEIYGRALQKGIREESRYIEISVILEMLLMPSQNTELSYRFSLRLAKVMNKLFGESTVETFRLARNMYTTRSKLVHSGHDRNLSSVSAHAYRYAQLLLASYVEDSSTFDEDNLEALCLA